VTIESDPQAQKHCLESVATEQGTQIDESDEQFANAALPTYETRERMSKMTGGRDPQ
jgi:hypothetical protein